MDEDSNGNSICPEPLVKRPTEEIELMNQSLYQVFGKTSLNWKEFEQIFT